MASSTPSAPINSSRGAADTTAGQIYFSTPSAQVRIPLTGPLLPPPPTSAHTILLKGKFIWRRKKLSGGGKIMRRRNNYPGRERVGQKFEKKCPKLLHSAENTLFYILIHCETIPYPYTLPKTLS